MKKIRVGALCHKCKYWSGRTRTCDYCNIMRQSRLYTNGKRLDPKFCNKFVMGKREYSTEGAKAWKNGKTNGERDYAQDHNTGRILREQDVAEFE